MAELTVAMAYGQALYEAAADAGDVDGFLQEAKELSQLFQENHQLNKLLCTPVIPAKERKAAMASIFSGRVRQGFVNLLYVVIDKGRGGAIHEIFHQFELRVEESEMLANGAIVSALALSDQEKARFEEETGKLLRKKVKLENQIDPKVLGGVRIFIEGKVLDATVETRLNEMQDRLMSAAV